MVLFLNDIGTSEVFFDSLLYFDLFGSKSIPSLARTMGRTMRQIKDASSEIQNEIRKSGEEMKGDLNLKGLIDETANDIQRPLDQYAQDIEDAMKYKPTNSQPRVSAAEIEKMKAVNTEKVELPEENTKSTSDESELKA